MLREVSWFVICCSWLGNCALTIPIYLLCLAISRISHTWTICCVVRTALLLRMWTITGSLLSCLSCLLNLMTILLFWLFLIWFLCILVVSFTNWICYTFSLFSVTAVLWRILLLWLGLWNLSRDLLLVKTQLSLRVLLWKIICIVFVFWFRFWTFVWC